MKLSPANLALAAGLALLAVPASAQLQNPFGYRGVTDRPAPMPAKPEHTLVAEGNAPRTIEVKFAHGSDTRLDPSGWFVGSSTQLGEVNSILTDFDARPRRMFVQSPAVLDQWRARGEERSGIVLQDLNLFYFVDVPADGMTGPLCDRLNQLEHVELAWPATTGGDPVAPSCAAPAPALLGGTPNFEGNQGYRTAAPTGIDALYGNTFSGGRGVGTTIVDCETGWTDDHEDLVEKAENQFVIWTPANYPWDHGTAVLGEMISGNNGFGVRGIVWEADVMLSTHTPVGLPQNIPGGVANGATAVGPGDALVIEIQCFSSAPGPHPCELDPAIFATIQTATANGVHVFAAAGNGGHDLDQAAYGGAFDFSVKDSGAVLVGASNGSSLAKASFSNYGQRTTSHGWGQNVASSGYGDLQSGPATQEYTAVFSGTSSATPIVTGAGVALNAIHREAFGADMDPIALRTVLEETGTPPTGTQYYGTRPNLRAAVRALGVPEIEVLGNPAPGAIFTVRHHGDPGDPYLLLWSPNISPTPLHLPPLGYLYLNPALLFAFPGAGVIGPNGTTDDLYFIAPDATLSGTKSFFQAFQAFATKPGSGSFSNATVLVIQ